MITRNRELILISTIIIIKIQMSKQILVIIFTLIATISCLDGVTELTDANFEELVKQDSSIWLVFFAADWCGHCQHLKPEIQKLAPRLQKLGVKTGHVHDKNNKLINDYVVDHKTHMVSYPKLKVFLGEEVLAEVPPGIRNQEQMYNWFKKEYSLSENTQGQL